MSEALPVARCVQIFEWSCDKCGSTNYARPVRPELTQDEIKELQEKYGTPDTVNDWMLVPSNVYCSACKTKHTTEDAHGGQPWSEGAGDGR